MISRKRAETEERATAPHMKRLRMASVLGPHVGPNRQNKKDTRPNSLFYSTLAHLRRVDLSVDLYEGHCNRGYCIDMVARWISWA